MRYRTSKRRARDFVHGVPGAVLPVAAVTPSADAGLADRVGAARSASPREAWQRWLAPRFPAGSLYFTGTYSDEYGFSHGCTLPRNVHKDFRRWLLENGLERCEFVCGVEPHAFRDVLHLHAIVAGDFSDLDRRLLGAAWAVERGHSRVLPVQDGCASYVTKYALKGDTECFDWNLAG